MKTLKTIFLFYVLNTFLFCNTYSKEDDYNMPKSLGFYFGFNDNLHNPAFKYQDSAAGPVYLFDNNSSSIRLNFGGIFNYPINKNFVFSGRLGINGSGAQIESKTSIDSSLKQFDASLNYLEITPAMQFHNLFPLKRLYLLGGLEFGIPVSGNYDMIQTKSTFGGTLTKTTNGISIPNKNIRIALALGVGYVFNLSPNVMLSPEISFRLPLTDISSSNNYNSWSVSQLRFGAALTFALEPAKEEPPTNTLDVGFQDVRYYDKENNKFPLKKITVEEVQYNELYPLIPYVFCGENSEYPTSKTQILSTDVEKGAFSMKSLPPDAMGINMRTLDLIGTRMSQNPEIELNITGTNDGAGEAKEDGLSLKRANFAKNYLIVNYSIKSERIKISSVGLPEKPSAKNDSDGIEENRRIEFSSSDKRLLTPILIEKEKQSIADPDLVEFVPYAHSNDSIANWELEIYQTDRQLRRFEGKGEPRTIKWTIMPNELAASPIPVEYTFWAETKTGLKKSASGSVPVDFYSISRKKVEEKPDRTISKYSLIVFDFDKSEISEQDKEIIENNVLPAIKYNSTIQIFGYTDRIGNEDYNKKLATKRANTVKELLQSKAKSAKFEVYGVGENEMIFDNDSPIGRQLSRTVQIYVITPKE